MLGKHREKENGEGQNKKPKQRQKKNHSYFAWGGRTVYQKGHEKGRKNATEQQGGRGRLKNYFTGPSGDKEERGPPSSRKKKAGFSQSTSGPA